jgi:predicted metal-dependent phosphoesterase TrpH
MHSTHSDGTFTPRELVMTAIRKKLCAIALTDHDTFSGVAEAQAAGAELGLLVLSGVEISVEYGSKTVHMLAYCYDSGADKLRGGLNELLRGRNERNVKIVANLNGLGMAITVEEIEAEAGGTVVGRPHIANVLIRKGYIQTRQEAFDKYLAKGAAAYEERLKFSPADSVNMILQAGGVPVLAHPKFVPLQEGETIEDVVRNLVSAGLRGIECYYSMHTEEETQQYLELAEKYNLIATGGSDFHGGNKPDIQMGTGLGQLRVPGSCADALAGCKA